MVLYEFLYFSRITFPIVRDMFRQAASQLKKKWSYISFVALNVNLTLLTMLCVPSFINGSYKVN